MLLLGVEAGFCLQVYIAQTYKKNYKKHLRPDFSGFFLGALNVFNRLRFVKRQISLRVGNVKSA